MPDSIRQWFIEHQDDDFILPPPGYAYSVLPPTNSNDPLIYTTKVQSLLAIVAGSDARPPFALVGRYGLPSETDLNWLLTFAGRRRVMFLGDADPADLLIFAWLRARMTIDFGGVGERLLKKFGIAPGPAMTIALTKAESEAMPLIREQFPAYTALLGPACSSLLDSGRKLEIEALVSFATVGPADLLHRLAEW